MDTNALSADDSPPIYLPFDASRFSTLVLGNMNARVTIIPMDTHRITLTHHRGNKDTLQWRVEGMTLTLEEKTTSDDSVEFALIVPSRLNLSINRLNGTVHIVERLDAALAFNISGSTRLKADSVEYLGGIAANFSRVEVVGVHKIADVLVTGAAEVIVHGGSAQRLRARVSRGGAVHYNGTTRSAELHAAGLGFIAVAYVTDRLDQYITEHGRIRAKKVPHWPYL